MIVSRWSLQGHCLEGKRPLPSCLKAGVPVALTGGLLFLIGWLTRPDPGPEMSLSDLFEYLGGAAMVFGVVWMLVRERRTLDGRARTLSDWSCLGWPDAGMVTRLGDIEAVVIDREAKVIRGRDLPDSVEDVDSVWILHRGGEFRQLDSFPNRPFEARRTAEGKGQPLPQPQEPPNLRFRCMESPEGLDIRIPRARLVDFWKPILWGLGLYAVALVLLVQFLADDWMMMLLVLDLFLRDFRENRIYRNYQVERYFPVGCLCARSDRLQACFGGSLDETNLEYLRALLLNRIVEYTRSD